MYDLILEALYRLNNLDSTEEKVQYLQSLKPAAQELRKSFNPSITSNVSVRYRSQVRQAAYMLRYFPYYSQVIHIILNRLINAQVTLPFDEEELSACFFGAGPAPEIYGFIQFLNSTFKNVRKIVAHTFDIISDEWAYSRDITEHYLIPTIWQNRKIELTANKFDLTQANSINKLAAQIGGSKLIVFQNCLNEINKSSYSNVVVNFKWLIRAMSSDSILMIIDLSSYPAARGLTSQIESLVQNENSASILVSLSESQIPYDAVAFRDALPLIIKQNLLTDEDGLKARRHVKYHCLVVRKI